MVYEREVQMRGESERCCRICMDMTALIGMVSMEADRKSLSGADKNVRKSASTARPASKMGLAVWQSELKEV